MVWKSAVAHVVVGEVILRKRVHAQNSHMTPASNGILLQALYKLVQRKRQLNAKDHY
ncbi:hypothetical protein BH10CYA1_BH10CYA1_52970 [soil metagenome]